MPMFRVWFARGSMPRPWVPLEADDLNHAELLAAKKYRKRVSKVEAIRKRAA